MRKTIALWVFIQLLPINFARADCGCPNDVEKPQAKYNRSRVVFTGQVTNIERLEDQSNIEFQVFNVYKGNLDKRVFINTVNAGSMAAVCGYQFKTGGEYLIYAYGTGSEGTKDIYYAEGCSSVKKLSRAREDLQKISQYTNIRNQQLDNTTLADLSLAKELGCQGDRSLCTVTVAPNVEPREERLWE